MHQGFHLNFQGYSHMRNMVMAELRNDLAAWRILLAAVRTGSIRETALQADLPAAKVSRIISELERELGFELLDRSTRPMKPTPSCRDLVEGMTPLLAGFDRMWEHFSKKEGMRHVSFAAPIDLCRLYFSALVARSGPMRIRESPSTSVPRRRPTTCATASSTWPSSTTFRLMRRASC